MVGMKLPYGNADFHHRSCMPYYICCTCGVQYAETETAPERCAG